MLSNMDLIITMGPVVAEIDDFSHGQLIAFSNIGKTLCKYFQVKVPTYSQSFFKLQMLEMFLLIFTTERVLAKRMAKLQAIREEIRTA